MIKTINDGAKKLLIDSVSILKENNPKQTYVIIGGWCPVLRKSVDQPHPGTVDVDILFIDADKEYRISSYIDSMLKNGFLVSAKHPFQLLKLVEVNCETFVYNVDLLHPSMMLKNPELFVDHIEHDVFIDSKKAQKIKSVSMVVPGSSVIFEENLFDHINVDGHDVCVVNWEGMFLTKLESCRSIKRPRDAYDIYLAFLSKAIDIANIKRICRIYTQLESPFEEFIKHITDNEADFNNKILKYNPAIRESAANEIKKQLTA